MTLTESNGDVIVILYDVRFFHLTINTVVIKI